MQQRKAKKKEVISNDVDQYLVDDIVDGEDDGNFDLLNWWRVNGKSKYPILEQIAKDVLAIPVSTIASESTFSTSGRVISPYRSSLSPKMVEGLICTQNWLRNTYVTLDHEPTPGEIELCETIEQGTYFLQVANMIMKLSYVMLYNFVFVFNYNCLLFVLGTLAELGEKGKSAMLPPKPKK